MAVPMPKLKVHWQFTCQNSESDGNSLAKNLSACIGAVSQTKNKTKGIQHYQLLLYFNQYLQWFILAAMDHTTSGWFQDPRKIILLAGPLLAGPLLAYQSLTKKKHLYSSDVHSSVAQWICETLPLQRH